MASMMPCLNCGSEKCLQVAAWYKAPVQRCAECGFMSRVPYVQELSERCAGCGKRCFALPEKEYRAEQRQMIQSSRVERILEMTGEALLRQESILEVGCGDGGVGNLLVPRVREYAGTEPDERLRKKACALYPGLCGSLIPGPFPEESRAGSFDGILMIDVLQFVPHPQEFLSRAALFLKPGGWLYLEVPDEEFLEVRSLVRRCLGLYPCSGVHPGHVNFFSRKALQDLLPRSGWEQASFRTVRLLTDAHRISVTMQGRVPWWSRAAAAVSRVLPFDKILHLGNLAVVARRHSP